jgi:hypothetical protein
MRIRLQIPDITARCVAKVARLVVLATRWLAHETGLYRTASSALGAERPCR